jgi:hypothetical protein
MAVGFECGFRDNWSQKNLKYQHHSIHSLNFLIFHDTEGRGKNWVVVMG